MQDRRKPAASTAEVDVCTRSGVDYSGPAKAGPHEERPGRFC
jgi:hypothetical protein